MSRRRRLPAALTLAVLSACAACGSSSDSSSSDGTPSPTTAFAAGSSTTAADDEAATGPAQPAPISIEVTFDDGAETLTSAIAVGSELRAEQAAATYPEAAFFCSGESFSPGELFAVKIDHSATATASAPASAAASELLAVEVVSTEPVDGAGTFPAEVFVLLAGGTSLELPAAELVVADDLVSGSFHGVSAAGVQLDATFSCA